MNFAFNEEQEELRRSAESFLADNAGSEKMRAAEESDLGYDEALWQRIGGEMGWTAVHIPEQYGGLGLGTVELTALLEKMGAALLCSPFYSSVCLGANALLSAGSEAQKEALLPEIAAGTKTATLAFAEANGRWDAGAVEATWKPSGSGYRLDGTKKYVLDGASADLLIVAARAEGSTGEEGIGLFALPADAPGIERKALPTMDRTRRQAEIALNGVETPAESLLSPDGQAGNAWTALSRTLDLGAIALAAEQAGGAERVLDMTVAYAKERVQFGRAIGSFQAIKHKCADMMVLTESAKSAAYYAGAAVDADDPETPLLASLAKAYCSDAYFRAAAESIQIHGGVGFTWEYDVHFYFKRAKSTEAFLGSPAFHRERVAAAAGLVSEAHGVRV